MDAAKMRAKVESYMAAYNARDLTGILSLYADDATMEDPVGLPAATTRAEIAGLYEMGFEMGVTLALDGAIRCTSSAVAFPLCASTPTSKLYVIDVFEFSADEKIERMRAYWGQDNLEGDLKVRT
jgi:steroid delta-isomerase